MKAFLVLSFCVLTSAIILDGEGGDGGGRHHFHSSSSSESHSHSHEHHHRPPRPPRPPGPPRPPVTPPPANCPAGWTQFARPSGAWCMRVFYSPSVDYADAQRECQGNGGTLSGFQNYQEILFATGEVTRTTNMGSLWFGAERVSSCMGVGLGGFCTPQTAFRWTDGSTTGNDGWWWDTNMPDNWTRQQNCAVLLAGHGPYRAPGGLVYNINRFDDNNCAGTMAGLSRLPRRIYGYVCGRRPT